jgi:hypothetical protein
VDKDPYADVKGHYYSIREFTVDQWKTHYGVPFTIIKTVREAKGDEKKIKEIAYAKIDSSYTNSDTINWGNIFDVFFATDISDRKFLGKYTYSEFEDPAEGNMNRYYRANDDDLFTQKFLITTDLKTSSVVGIYIETYKKTVWTEIKQKLYYAPMKTIQIQTDEKPSIGSHKYTVLQYYLQYAGN